MDRYEVLLFLHVSAAIVWVGMGLTLFSLLFWADRSGDRPLAAKLLAAIGWLEPRAVVAGPLLLLATGVALVVDGPWRFGDVWIAFGLGGYAASYAWGFRFASPELRRLRAIVAERGADHADVQGGLRRLLASMRVDLGIFAVVVLDMSVKPTADSVGFWVTTGAILAFALGLAARAYRAAEEPAPEAPPVAPGS